MDSSTPGLPVHHQFPELTQTHVHWVSDAIQPSHHLWSPSPLTFSLSYLLLIYVSPLLKCKNSMRFQNFMVNFMVIALDLIYIKIPGTYLVHSKYLLSDWVNTVYSNMTGFSWWLSGKESFCKEGEAETQVWSQVWKIPWRRNGNPFQYSCLENSTQKGAWWATVYGITKKVETIEWLNNNNKNLITGKKWKLSLTF